MSASLCTLKDGMSYTKQLPSKGLSQNQVLEKIKEYKTLSKFSCLRFTSCLIIFTDFMKSIFNLLLYHFELRRRRLCKPMLGFITDNESYVTLCHIKKTFYFWETCDFWRDDVSLQMRWSGRKAVFPVLCTGAMKHWPNSWWRYASLNTIQAQIVSVELEYILTLKLFRCFFFFLNKQLPFIPENVTAALVCVSVNI